jgi:hypothetical protein
MKEEIMKTHEGNEKQAYEKPRLRTIELAAEEILAIGCKSTMNNAPGSSTPPCMIRHCSGKGS